ncbi:MAG TPA: glycosyltransferase 87 family protein, partial [Mycobacteriales bacterium]|nr:glycosyltransferase 87 family protein [Mycobacteriales bacterium]
PAHEDGQFLAVSALCLAPFGLATGWLLARMTGWRALVWAAAPALVFYGFLNWDLLVTAAFVTAVWCWWRGRITTAAVWLGVGTALKLYPAVFVLPLAVSRLAAGDRRGAARVVAASAGTYLVVNLPFILANPDGWWATYAFQSGRDTDVTTDSIWYWGFPRLDTGTVNHLSATLIALAWALALAIGWWRSRSGRRAGRQPGSPTGGGYPWVQVSAAMLCAFLLFNKVHSPQYMLWLLPFFVLVRIRAGWWLAYMAADATLFVGLFHWYQTLIDGGDFGLAKQATIVGVWGRAVLLALLYAVFLRAPLAPRPRRRDGQPSRPDGTDTDSDGGSDGGSDPTADPTADPAADPGTRLVANSGAGADSPSHPSRSQSAGSNTPPAGSRSAQSPSDPGGGPEARTTSRSGARMSRITSAQYTSTAVSRIRTASRNHCSSTPLFAVPRYQYIRGNHRNTSVACQAR